MTKTKQRENKEIKKVTKKLDKELSKELNCFGCETKGSFVKSNKAIIVYAVLGLVLLFTCSVVSASVIQSSKVNTKINKNTTNTTTDDKPSQKFVIKNGKQFVVLSKKEVITFDFLKSQLALGFETKKD